MISEKFTQGVALKSVASQSSYFLSLAEAIAYGERRFPGDCPECVPTVRVYELQSRAKSVSHH